MTHPRWSEWMWRPVVGLAALVLLATPALAFKVVKNVNSGEPPVEKLVLFAKGQTDGITIDDRAKGGTMAFTDDGMIEEKITGYAEVTPTISWSAAGDRKETFDANQYAYLLVRCKLEGDIQRKLPNGKVTSSRPDNLWFALRLYDNTGQRCGQVNLASVTEDEKTPAEMVTVKVPMLLLTNTAFGDTKNIAAVGFYWPQTHDYNDRQCRLVVERISLAD